MHEILKLDNETLSCWITLEAHAAPGPPLGRALLCVHTA